jgi:nucleotide-binding universal stress UspA family protein
MGDSPVNKATYLALDELAENPKLARRLTPELARRAHALPLAEANGRVTVVMADPADAEARDAVLTALGPTSCVVQGDVTAIDAVLSRIWAGEAGQPLSLLICGFPEPVSDEVAGYIQAIGELLQAHVDHLSTAGETGALSEGQVDHDLVIFDRGEHLLVQRLLSQPLVCPAGSQRRVSSLGLLVAQQPRWPLKKILLVVQGEGGDDLALEWVLRLARPAGSTVTALVVVPPVPAMYGQHGRMSQGLPDLLSADSPLGQQMRGISQRLVNWEVPGTLRLRQGSPDRQICREVVEGEYDLVVLAASPPVWWRRCLEGDLVGPLLRGAGRPVLVTRPTTA